MQVTASGRLHWDDHIKPRWRTFGRGVKTAGDQRVPSLDRDKPAEPTAEHKDWMVQKSFRSA